MKLVILNGSPRAKGSSSRLLAAFQEGAQEAGHSIARFDLAWLNLHPCRACYYCEAHGGECVQKDDAARVIQQVLAADLVVFSTPLYYFGMSAQLKILIDRFFAFDARIRQKKLKSVLITPMADSDPSAVRALVDHYGQILRYLRLQDQGQLLAMGINEPEDLDGTDYLPQARALGRNLV